MRDRLIELINDYTEHVPHEDGQTWEEAFADHLIANGVIVPPCKVGDVVYGFHPGNGTTILPMVAKWIETNEEGWTVAVQYVPMAPKFYLFSDFGKTVFLTREAAKQALKERSEKE